MQQDSNDIPQIETAPDAEEAPSKPYIHCEFNGELSAEILVNMDKVTPIMLWGAASMIKHYADQLWEQNELQLALAEQAEQQEHKRDSGLVVARGIPQDHLSKQRRN